jgi:ABC-2 type transport system permease protein
MRLDVIRRISRKELTLFFASPVGYLFLAVFLAVTLFVFFWVEAFFARNIADVRPMFEWMPLLLIFLCAALTMRMWSEERRTGTLEFVVTLPASTWEFVLGKFLACWLLLLTALLLTLPLPVSVALMADLDWGPVFAGYLAALLLGGAYLAIGLFISSRTDSQIVSLIVACVVSGAFYLIGSSLLTDLVSGQLADVMRGVGSGSRFESITRGVLDFRDLYYYGSLLLAFMALNVYTLETRRWAVDGDRQRHRSWFLGTGFLVANLLLANVWLSQVSALRMDVTRGNQYSISDATRSYLRQLREPLLIRGYFSAKTHPYLAPLVPQMRDLLNEYAIAGGSNVRVEVVDPVLDPALEDEANSKYGIRPNPFQVADRYQSSLVNSYFDVLISYGDEYEVLSFRDLIEVKVAGESELDVQLRNPEFDLTRSIKKVIYGFQGGDSLFTNITRPVEFVGFISDDTTMPVTLIEYRDVLDSVLAELEAESQGKFTAEILDPLADDGALALELAESYGFQPMATSLLDTKSFYFYLTLSDGETVVQIPLPEALSEEATKRGIEEGLKRYASGLLKTVALMAPERPPYIGMGQPQGGNQFIQLRDTLQADFNVQTTQLADGRIPENADMLMVIDPEGLDEKQVFAIDQFLMRGGTVAIATSPFAATLSQQSLVAQPRESGLTDWLTHHGLSIGESFVMDPQNAAFPAPVQRQVGGFTFQELVMLDYPYFVDIRDDEIDAGSGIFSGIPQLTMSWSSPVVTDAEKNSDRRITRLLGSSSGSWLSDSLDIMPRINEQGLSAYLPAGETGAQTLAVMLEGRFRSAYEGRQSPLLETPDSEGEITDTEETEEDSASEDQPAVISSVIDRSPESARLVVFASNSFLADQTLSMIGSAEGVIYSNRARGQFNRTLPPMAAAEQSTVEYLNYALALLGILLVYLIHQQRLKRARALHAGWLEGVAS